MAENKTKPTSDDVTAFLTKIPDQQLRNDCLHILKLMQTISKSKPVMWGSSIIGFGTIHYVYESGREGDMPVIAFSPRKHIISLYVGLDNVRNELTNLGKYKTGKGCLYIGSLGDVKVPVLKKLLTKAYRERVRKNVNAA